MKVLITENKKISFIDKLQKHRVMSWTTIKIMNAILKVKD